jgi:hypothetical protein
MMGSSSLQCPDEQLSFAGATNCLGGVMAREFLQEWANMVGGWVYEDSCNNLL